MTAWHDRPSFTSVREDGAKVGGFWVPKPDGSTRLEFWGYPKNGCPTGPHQTCEEAKAAVDAALPLDEEPPIPADNLASRQSPAAPNSSPE